MPAGLPPTVARNTPPAVIAEAISAAVTFALRVTEIVLVPVLYVTLVALSAEMTCKFVLWYCVPPGIEVNTIEWAKLPPAVEPLIVVPFAAPAVKIGAAAVAAAENCEVAAIALTAAATAPAVTPADKVIVS